MIDYKEKYDVIVVGGGTGGVPAAIAAARNGASVLLIEKNGFLGGTETGGMQIPWGYRIGKNVWQDLKDPYVEGIFTEILGRLRELGALATEGYAWDEAVLKFVLEDLCIKAGVHILLHSFVFRVSVDRQKITSVEVANKSGARSFAGKFFIDGTGSADLIALSGARWEKGRALDGATQAMSLTFRLGGVDTDKLPNYSPDRHRFEVEKTGVKEMPKDIEDMHKAYLEAQKNGEISSPRPFLTWWRHFRPSMVHSDTVWVQNLDATKAEDLTEAEINGKRQIMEIWKFLKTFPAFKNSFIIQMGSEIGVRETRRIVGEYVLNKEDLLNGKKFDDGIARGFGAMAIHGAGEKRTIALSVPPYTTYDIPYRSLTPKDLDNVLIGSKCISCTHEALGAVREEAPVSAIGQAAGTAAALACQKKVTCKQLDIQLLRNTLKEQGANVWQPGMLG